MSVYKGAEIKVGIFVCIALVALGYMSMQVGQGFFGDRDMKNVRVEFDNVTGLKQGAPVEIAGIDVGQVKSIGLSQGKAELTLALNQDVDVPADVQAVIRTRGMLGDKFVELRGGSSGMPELEEGQRITRSSSPEDLDQLLQKVGQIADDISTVSRSVSNVFGGEQGEAELQSVMDNVRELTGTLNGLVQQNAESVQRIVANLDGFTADMQEMSAQNKEGVGKAVEDLSAFAANMREITGENKEGVQRIVANLDHASGQLQHTMQAMQNVLGKVDEGEGTLGTMVNDKEMAYDLKKTMTSLESVSRKIDKGRGTLGKLVNDNSTGKELDKALEGVNTFLSKQEQFKTSVDFTSEYLADTGDIKSYLNLKLQPSEDKYYLLSLIDDPKGRTETTSLVRHYKEHGQEWKTYREEEKETKEDGLKFSAQLAKRWDNLVLRGGIIESSGGAGLDYYLWDDRIKLFAEAFDFDDENPPHLKAGGKLYFLNNFYVSAGMDDFASDTGDESFFTGLGLRFSDDDLKYLMGKMPLPE
ncbi:MAG: MlaD family protein [Thermodesulfobacteriota bacterium]